MTHPLSAYYPLIEKLKSIYDNNTREEIIMMAMDELLYQSTRPRPDSYAKLEAPMVLIEIRNPQGIQARCDANCYDADTGICNCPCGTANHGQGLTKSIANMPSIVEKQIPELWIRNAEDTIPPGCKSFAILPIWVDVPTHGNIAGMARILQEARQTRHSQETAQGSEPSGTK